MKNILPALAPVFILIAMGFVIRRRAWIDPQFWAPCEKINYFCMFPALMFAQVARADFGSYPLGGLAATLLGAVAITAALLYGWKGLSRQDGAEFSSIVQGALRPNTYTAVAAAALLYGTTGVTLASLSIAIAIPLLNIASIVVLMAHAGQGRPRLSQLLNALIRNPVILSVTAGLAYRLADLVEVPVLFPVLDILGAASLPLGLLAVGAGLDLDAARTARGPVALSSAAKLLLVPGLTAVLGHYQSLPGTALITAVVFNAMPCTPSAYIMTRLLGGDHRLAASIISVQTVLAAFTVPAVLALTSLLLNP